MSESRLWTAVLVVASVGLLALGRNVLADRSAERVGRRVAFSPEVLRAGRTPISGSSDAPYVLVEFMDYECGPCRELHDKLGPVLRNPKIALMVRQHPLREIHPFADRAARYALGVADGPAASATHDALFRVRWSEDNWREFLRAHAKKSVRSPDEVAARLREDEAAAKAAQVQGTPQLFLIHGGSVFEVTAPEALATL